MFLTKTLYNYIDEGIYIDKGIMKVKSIDLQLKTSRKAKKTPHSIDTILVKRTNEPVIMKKILGIKNKGVDILKLIC